MKYLGMLYGAELYLDSDDEKQIELVETYLKRANEKLYPIKTDEEIYQEVIDKMR